MRLTAKSEKKHLPNIVNLKTSFLKTFESSQEILNFNLGKDDADKIIRGCSIDQQFNSIKDQIAYFEDGSRFESLSEQDQELRQWAKDFKDLSLIQITSEEDIKKFKEYKIKYYEKLFEERFIDKDQAKLIIEALEKIESKKTLPDKTDETLPNSEITLQTENEKTARLAKIIDDFKKLDWKGENAKYDTDIIYKGYSRAEFKTPKELMDKIYPNQNYPNPNYSIKVVKKLFDVYVDELCELAKKDNEIVGENESSEEKTTEQKMQSLEELIKIKEIKQIQIKEQEQIKSFIKSLEDIPLIAGVNGFATLRTNILEEKRDEKDFEEISKKNAENINELYKLVKNQEKNSKKFSLEKLPNELFKIMQQNKNFEALVSCLSFGLLASEKGKAPEKKAENKELEPKISKDKKIQYIEKFIKERQSPNFQTAITDYNTLISQVLIDKAKDLFNKGQNGNGGR